MPKSTSLDKLTKAATSKALTVDSATLYEMVSLFSLQDGAYGWAMSAAEALTTSLIGLNKVDVAKAPRASGSAGELYGELTNYMHSKLQRRLVPFHVQPPADSHEPHKETVAWVQANAANIAHAYICLRNDPNFHPWLDFSKRTAWLEHANRLKGLFDEEFMQEIDLVLQHVSHIKNFYNKNVPNLQGLKNLLNESRKLKRGPTGAIALTDADATALEHAYIVSALIRGYYHQMNAAKRDGVILTRHPFRGAVFARVQHLNDNKLQPETPYAITNTQSFLSRIIIASAMKPAAAEQRVRCWVDNVEIAAKAYDGSLDLDEAYNDDRAFSKAISVARSLGFIADNKKIERYVAGTIALGSVVPEFIHLRYPEFHMPYSGETSIASLASAPITAFTGLNGKITDSIKKMVARREMKELRLGNSGTISYANYQLPCRPSE